MPDFPEENSPSLSSLSEIDYRLMAAEFDLLWARPPNARDRRRMDYIIGLISAFEDSRGKLSLS